MQAAVAPKCGRMVAFTGGIKNLHGVLGVTSGRRCALPLWFTYQKDKVEDNRGKYLEILNNFKKQLLNSLTEKENDNNLGQTNSKAEKLSNSPDIQKTDLGSQIRTEL